jgi:serine/threonine protein kinase
MQENLYLDNYELIKIFLDVSNGIYYLHSKNLVHSDIKTKNILVIIYFTLDSSKR